MRAARRGMNVSRTPYVCSDCQAAGTGREMFTVLVRRRVLPFPARLFLLFLETNPIAPRLINTAYGAMTRYHRITSSTPGGAA